MAGYILRGEEKNLVLRAADVDAVLQSGNADAALLYLALMRASGGVTAEALCAALQMSALRFSAAETALQELGLLGARPAPPPPERERTAYTAQEMAALLEDGEFAALRRQVERKLDKRLTAADDQILAGLYHDVGFPAEVLFLLVCHCAGRTARRYGEGRRPTLRQIEKEGYYWARLGIFDQERADRYLRDYDRKREAAAAYMQVLRLGDRPPVDSEQRYISDWIDKGLPPEVVALAYDRTVLRKQGLDWRYLNGILRRWHESGWHTVEAVEQGEQRGLAQYAAGGAAAKKEPRRSSKAWIKQYDKG